MKSGPVLHRPIPMEARVIVPAAIGTPRKGTVIGIAEFHVVYRYIVLLDEPLATEDGVIRALAIQGTLLEGEDGSNWRLPPRTGLDG